MIEIDGSLGEGGGQVLRTALSLSCITGKPFRIFNIRKLRSKPGLRHQHLVAVQAAARLSSAEVSGDQLGSTQVSFTPHPVRPGAYDFDIGTAGSTPLVLQTLIPPLLRAGGPSRLTLRGGTHNPLSPSWHYLAEVFAPTLLRLGARIELTLERCGFYPKGGGRVHCRIHPCAALTGLNTLQRGQLQRITGISAVGNLPLSIAERQAHSALSRLESVLGAAVPMEVDRREVDCLGQGTFIFLRGEYQHAVSGFTSLGARGKPAEVVGDEAATEFLSHHATGMPVDPHLADQLVLYLALAEGPSEFTTSRITSHLVTNLQVIGYFLDLVFKLKGEHDSPGIVTIETGG
jgi:RNA 3'-terminal phosphate cyclase (ATP)